MPPAYFRMSRNAGAVLMRLCLSVTALSMVISTYTVAQTHDRLASCLQGLAACDLSSLSQNELQQISQRVRERNYERCMSGSNSCDPTALTPEEARNAKRSWQQRNTERCVTALASCDPLALSDADRRAVNAATRRRNIEACLSGSSRCSPMELSPAELERVPYGIHDNGIRNPA